MPEPFVLIIGAADTGRAPMAAALLGRLAARQGLAWSVGSAGVVGHDGDPAEPEARSAMLALGLDIGGHLARSLSPELAAAAAVCVAIDSGVARVVRASFPDQSVVTLGELAGSPRNIPDPFRMAMGAWLQYAGEIEALLRAGMPRLRALVEQQAGAGEGVQPGADEPAGGRSAEAGPGEPGPERQAALERAVRLLSLAADMPGVVDGAGAAAQLAADLAILEEPQTADDLARPYVALIRARLAPTAPQGEPARALAAAVARLRGPIAPADLEALARAFA